LKKEKKSLYAKIATDKENGPEVLNRKLKKKEEEQDRGDYQVEEQL
jgi:hypothetical protein